MKTKYPDIHRLFQVILEDGAPTGVSVIVDLDGEDYEDMPVVTWRTITEGQIAHGLWRVTLILNVIFDIADEATDDLLPSLYAQIHGWNEPGEGVLATEKYGVESVEDAAVFDLIFASIVNGKNVSQYAAQFTVLVRDWS